LGSPEKTRRVGVKRTVLIVGAAGLALSIWLIAKVGFGKIVLAFATIGWRGLLAMCLTYLVPIVILALAWLVLNPSSRLRALPTYFFARLVRDTTAELLPFSSLGGFVFGARAAILGGVDPAMAISTTVVDVTAEFIGQIGFTALGLGLLAYRPAAELENQQLLSTSLLGLAAAALAAVGFVFIQRRASGFIERAVARWAPSALAQTSAVTSSLHALYQRPGRLTVSSILHFASWIVAAVGVWAGLWIAGRHFSVRTIVGVESLIYALRSIAFAAPMGLGVIETGYVLVGHLFGLSPEFALALSLIKRARDIIIGLPAIGLWQLLEGRRLLRAKKDAQDPTPAEDQAKSLGVSGSAEDTARPARADRG
jgi:putative membrane protein